MNTSKIPLNYRIAFSFKNLFYHNRQNNKYEKSRQGLKTELNTDKRRNIQELSSFYYEDYNIIKSERKKFSEIMKRLDSEFTKLLELPLYTQYRDKKDKINGLNKMNSED